MDFRQIPCGGDRNFGYLVADEGTGVCAVVDPAPDPREVAAQIRASGYTVRYIINTHDHSDHTGGNEAIKDSFGGQVVLHAISGRGDVDAQDGDVLEVGALRVEILHTPGHTPDSICVLVERHLITGDTLFVGKVGGTSNREQAATEAGSLRRLMALEEDITVWPGHDVGVSPSSTIARERETNPFCARLGDLEQFHDLKENWAAYKREHGIA